ncbi:J domain-containing protein [Gryllotalpicola protaetiae]|uniref:Molecular chaperone DnaJ n=1 Tax=Gryllotalpicola protaetiae TaxID=2419771 RepID=A0A387BWE8_9MICO|nr:DnaJ domain-containing protein [Gryllotalpicola protaetiae]AYG05436.1 molecular chaperone DnaJ [Gryllotalpicola protaetiae]
MPESPLSASPYEVLGVDARASEDELKRAYRRRLRETHPDTGGSAAEFRAVQEAWERIGTPEARAIFNRSRSPFSAAGGAESGGGGASDDEHVWATSRTEGVRRDTRPRARSYGHPGGWRRERYLAMMREWAGRGTALDDPYDPALVRTAPYEIRHTLADALAEEATARATADLGIGYTVWHDVFAHDGGKIDHLVLGPTGLFALQSEDYGGAVTVKRGELIPAEPGVQLDGRPAHDLAERARHLGRALGVKFAGAIVVLPDDALEAPGVEIGKYRGIALLAVQSSVLGHLLREGVPGVPRALGLDLFEVRSRLQRGVRFI